MTKSDVFRDHEWERKTLDGLQGPTDCRVVIVFHEKLWPGAEGEFENLNGFPR